MTKEVNGKKREVVMITDVATGRQTIKMRFKPGEKAEKERLVAMNAQRQKKNPDVWEREDLAEPGQEGAARATTDSEREGQEAVRGSKQEKVP